MHKECNVNARARQVLFAQDKRAKPDLVIFCPKTLDSLLKNFHMHLECPGWLSHDGFWFFFQTREKTLGKISLAFSFLVLFRQA